MIPTVTPWCGPSRSALLLREVKRLARGPQHLCPQGRGTSPSPGHLSELWRFRQVALLNLLSHMKNEGVGVRTKVVS